MGRGTRDWEAHGHRAAGSNADLAYGRKPTQTPWSNRTYQELSTQGLRTLKRLTWAWSDCSSSSSAPFFPLGDDSEFPLPLRNRTSRPLRGRWPPPYPTNLPVWLPCWRRWLSARLQLALVSAHVPILRRSTYLCNTTRPQCAHP